MNPKPQYLSTTNYLALLTFVAGLCDVVARYVAEAPLTESYEYIPAVLLMIAGIAGFIVRQFTKVPVVGWLPVAASGFYYSSMGLHPGKTNCRECATTLPLISSLLIRCFQINSANSPVVMPDRTLSLNSLLTNDNILPEYSP